MIDSEDPQLPREVTLIPETGSIIQFNAGKSLIIIRDTASSTSTWRAGEKHNLFVTLAKPQKQNLLFGHSIAKMLAFFTQMKLAFPRTELLKW